MPKVKFYAVSVGRDGPNIYTSWDECSTKITRFPGAKHKSFSTREQAEKWLKSSVGTYNANNHRRIGDQPFQHPPTPDKEAGDSPTTVTTLKATGLLVDPIIVLDSESEEELTPLSPPQKEKPLPQPPANKIVLSPEQQKVLDKVNDGQNVFFTGSAGTGKSVLLREIIKSKLKECGRDGLAITAATGIASINIGGTTLHSWAGIGIGDEDPKKTVWKFIKNPERFKSVLKRWRSVQTLIIDEISMIDGTLFDKLEFMARELKEKDLPFGGIQLVLSGDFCQLPPVSSRDSKGIQIPAMFAFDARTWSDCVGDPITLNRVFRQKDQQFVDMLNSMRFGQLTPAAINAFSKLSRKVQYDDGIEPTELFPTRKEVTNSNESRLRQLPGKPLEYQASDLQGRDPDGNITTLQVMERLLDRLVAPSKVHLKVGAQVMLIKNVVQGVLVNGSLGQVTGFSTVEDATRNGIGIARPEIKSDSDSDEDLDSDSETPAKPTATGSDPASRRIRANIPLPTSGSWPVVKFLGHDREVLCIPLDFMVNNAIGHVEAMRVQIPLILAWALSVHKSQGQTLQRVKVDLKRIFESGQAYVALSRATTMEHLQVLNFHPSKVRAHPRVLEWHNMNKTLPEEDYDKYFDEEFEDELMNAFYSSQGF
ncbi:hypothetical protein AX16_002577 [Volvariella volvacea WC 439]|nr:hypothetical protein AX16_002577 [Volvariella volvacea WC 439]